MRHYVPKITELCCFVVGLVLLAVPLVCGWQLTPGGVILGSMARAENATAAPGAPEDWSVHAQATGIYQGTARYRALYDGPNSLNRGSRWRETTSATVFLGRRLWDGGEIYFDPEFDQGFGLNHTTGVGGFPNGEASHAGSINPRFTIPRLFARQIFGLGGPDEAIEGEANQLAGSYNIARVVVTVGKMAAIDQFDDNAYAHDPRVHFLNWALMANGAWDYPADAKGYTDGVTIELNRADWALRWGYFLMPQVAQGKRMQTQFLNAGGQVAEFEQGHRWLERPGKLRLLVFVNRAHMGSYREALDRDDVPPDITQTRENRYKAGFGLNLEQQLTDGVGVFSRVGWSDGRNETYAFTEIDNTASLGVSIQGDRWRRADDTLGFAAVSNGLSRQHRDYLAAGGIGFIVGDGRLRYGREQILETYYRIGIVRAFALTADYQFVNNPAYNQDRGPVSIFAIRLHGEF
jgi:high affinity Mn2+ porin